MAKETRIVLDVVFDDPGALLDYLRNLADHLEEYGFYSAKLRHGGADIGYIQIDERDSDERD